MPSLLAVEDLAIEFPSAAGRLAAVDGVSFAVEPGETLGIVGESGSGKSVTALALMGLVPPPGRIARGTVALRGQPLPATGSAAMRAIRGRDIAMVFQDPMTSLNPVLTIGRQVTEPLELHLGLSARAARERAVELLATVGIPMPAARLAAYPHQLSGGMRQRVMIAMALACDPAVLIADEPTTALDVTTQAQILELIAEQRRARGMAVVLITHDLGVVAGCTDRVAVMYAGRIVEEGSTDQLFADPRMPYTAGLLRSVPRLEDGRNRRLMAIPGAPPDLAGRGPGCAFAPRCAHVEARCGRAPPPLRLVSPGHRAACVVDVAALPDAPLPACRG